MYSFFFTLLGSRPINRPSFSAKIHFYNRHMAKSEYSLDCSTSAQVLYYNHAPNHHLIFRTLNHFWNEGDSYFITLDEGVLFSNNAENSTEYKNPKFWPFTVVRPPHFPHPHVQ